MSNNALVIDTTPGQPYADIIREFEAPATAVFHAHADPELFKVWIGPRSLATELPVWDFRTGGAYRFVQTEGQQSYGFRGVFHTVRENELIVQTFEFDGSPDAVSLDIIRFEDLPGGRSRLVSRSVMPSVEALEAMVGAGMEVGVREGYEKLDELLAV